LQRKESPNFPERTIDFPGQDDIPSRRGRYTFLGGTTLVPRRDDKDSHPGRYKFPGKTISESPHISRRGRYIFPSGTIYLACGRPDLHKPLPNETIFARGLAPKQLRLPGEDDMGTLVHRNPSRRGRYWQQNSLRIRRRQRREGLRFLGSLSQGYAGLALLRSFARKWLGSRPHEVASWLLRPADESEDRSSAVTLADRGPEASPKAGIAWR
jgi:hypothetical protein